MRFSAGTTRRASKFPSISPDAEKLMFVQAKLDAGHAGRGEDLAEYRNISWATPWLITLTSTILKYVLLLGRCTSGRGGTLILEQARKVVEAEFPQLDRTL